MIKCTSFALFLSLPALALAGNDGDAVNERIPVDKVQLEAHWRVNCAAAWSRLQKVAAAHSTTDQCQIGADLAREIKLCAFIYQAPGDDSTHQCPDYRGISRQLEQSREMAGCPQLPTSIANQAGCDSEVR